jgi:hypothetical protein
MPVKTQNQEILSKVNYFNRKRNERNILDKYNKVKKSPRKKLMNSVSNDI